jgi:hypothetical protein
MDFFPVYVVGFAVIVIAILAAWLFAISCMDLMREAWEAMRGREWRQPEGPLWGPGKQPPKPPRETFTTGRARNGDAP